MRRRYQKGTLLTRGKKELLWVCRYLDDEVRDHSPEAQVRRPRPRCRDDEAASAAPHTMAKRKLKKDDGPPRHLWEGLAAIVGAALALAGTDIWPVLYWPGVAVVYASLVGLLTDAARGKFHANWWVRLVFSLIICTALAWWTFGFVLAKAFLRVDSKAGLTATGADLRIYLDNPSDYAFKDIEIEIFVDGMMYEVSQLEPICQRAHVFPRRSSHVSEYGGY